MTASGAEIVMTGDGTMSIQENTSATEQRNRIQPPPPRKDGPTFVTPSAEVLEQMRIETYGDPVALSKEQFPEFHKKTSV
jgi:hypothetical protein